MELDPGKYMIQALKKFDEMRIKKAEKSPSDLEKKIRLKRNISRKKLEDFYEKKEDP